MEQEQLQQVAAAIGYIEDRLDRSPDLQSVAEAVHYSKYYLHRLFTAAVGLPLHDYIRRRRLTRAAERLVFTSDPIARVALGAGYESQQAFTGIFGAMYKRTPLEYRRRGVFYPLQLPFTPCAPPSVPGIGEVSFAQRGDVGDWMELTRAVVGGFPCFDAGEHQARLEEYIARRQALVLRDSAGFLAGAAAFSPRTGSIDFLGVHPQYRRQGVDEALLSRLRDLLPGDLVTITTFRAGDRADPGQRADYQSLGFREGELLTEFGYPTQRLYLDREEGAGFCGRGR